MLGVAPLVCDIAFQLVPLVVQLQLCVGLEQVSERTGARHEAGSAGHVGVFVLTMKSTDCTARILDVGYAQREG